MLKKIINSFSYALSGLKLACGERNFRIHIFAFVMVFTAGLFYDISGTEWMIICLVSFFVLALEIVNTSIETLCNYINKEHSHEIKKVKDLSAAAVLIAAISAVAVGLVIFLPKIFP